MSRNYEPQAAWNSLFAEALQAAEERGRWERAALEAEPGSPGSPEEFPWLAPLERAERQAALAARRALNSPLFQGQASEPQKQFLLFLAAGGWLEGRPQAEAEEGRFWLAQLAPLKEYLRGYGGSALRPKEKSLLASAQRALDIQAAEEGSGSAGFLLYGLACRLPQLAPGLKAILWIEN